MAELLISLVIFFFPCDFHVRNFIFSGDNIEDIYTFAHCYCYSQLVTLCEDYLIHSIDGENCVGIIGLMVF